MQSSIVSEVKKQTSFLSSLTPERKKDIKNKSLKSKMAYNSLLLKI
jgi:hypothetical protein